MSNTTTYASIEHRRCKELADAIFGKVRIRWPALWDSLSDFRSIEELFHDGNAWVVGVERSVELLPIGNVRGVSYDMIIRRSDRVEESRTRRHPDPKMMSLVSMSELSVRLKPSTVDAELQEPTTTVELIVGHRADEESPTAVMVICSVPVAGKTSRTDAGALRISSWWADDQVVARRIMTLQELAYSDDPELGLDALRGVEEVLETARDALAG